VIVGLDVTFSPEALLDAGRAASQRSSIASAQGRLLGRLPALNSARVRRFAYIPYIALEVDEPSLQALAAAPEVRRVEIDRLLAPMLAQSTALIGAPAAWNAGYTGAGWTIAVLDTGVDKTHPFLAGKVVSEACYSTTSDGFSTSVCPGGAQSSTDPGAAAPCTMADCAHGTHVAGTAAGNGSGFSGVAKDASLIAIQVFSSITTECAGEPAPCARAFESDLIAGLERVYALRSTYSIAAANLSLGSGIYGAPCDSDASKAIIDQLRDAGIASVVSSGNDGSVTGISSPACVSTAISVGSTTDGSSGTAADQVSSFSNSSQYLTLLAPGQTITSSVPGNTFASFNGTSMAAPHVSGAWAVLKSRRPSASVSEVTQALVSTGVGIFDSGNGLTKPRIQLDAAVQALQAPCSYTVAPTSINLPRRGATIVLTVTTAQGCPWAASSSSPFVSPASNNGIGPDTVTLTVGPNPLVTLRQAVVTVAGASILVNQLGATAGDANGDGYADLFWRHLANGTLATWYIRGANVVATTKLELAVTDPDWTVAGSGDLDGDGIADIVWQHRVSGGLAVWYLSGSRVIGTAWLSTASVPDTNWEIRAVGDTNGDGFADLIWQHRTEGWLAVWLMNGTRVVWSGYLSVQRSLDAGWRIEAAGDLDRDGKADLVWRNDSDGGLAGWLMNGERVVEQRPLSIGAVTDQTWKLRSAGDVNDDGYADLFWYNTATGDIGIWHMKGFTVTATLKLSSGVGGGSPWLIVGPG
jgi:subtilisin family serine protease